MKRKTGNDKPFWAEPLMRYAPYADEKLNRLYRSANHISRHRSYGGRREDQR